VDEAGRVRARRKPRRIVEGKMLIPLWVDIEVVVRMFFFGLSSRLVMH
jgi:hypothetical protein